MDVHAKAQELADALLASQEYQRLKKAREAVEEHQAAKVMLRDFQEKQGALQTQQMEGKPISEEQTEQLRQLYEVLSINPYIRELFEAEFVFGGLMVKVQEQIGRTLGLTGDEDEVEESKTPQAEVNVETPKKKLWTPGT